MRQRHTSTMLTRQWWNTIEYLQNIENPYYLSLNYLIFTIHQIHKKNGELLFVVVGTGITTYALC